MSSIDPKLAALFVHNYNEALRIATRLQSSLQRLRPLFPLTKELEQLPEQQIDSIDAFRGRLSDLQDCLGNKVFRALLTLEEETHLSMLDTLHKMEKRGIIPSYQTWKYLRELRNMFSHDYPEAQAERTEALNMAYCCAPQMLHILAAIQTYTQKNLTLTLAEPPHAPDA
jgi:hypothetical protein